MDMIAILYTLAGFVFAAACLPQLRTLLRDTTGAASISLSSWAMFSACNIITLGYAMTHTGDRLFILCSLLCTVANCAVLSLACVRRLQHVTRRAD